MAERRGNALWDVLLSTHALDDSSTLGIKGTCRVFGLLDLWSTCLLSDENIDTKTLHVSPADHYGLVLVQY